MNKKFKKLIATVSAIVMCAVPMTAINSNAYWFMKSQEQYQAKVDILNNSEFSENRPDLCERFTKLIRWYDDLYDYYKFNKPEKRVENIWLCNGNDRSNTNPLMPYYTIDVLWYDTFWADIPLSETDDFTTETIKEEIGKIVDISNEIENIEVEYYYNNGLDDPAGISIYINFSGENHDENYKRCTDITESFKKYNVENAKAFIAWHTIETRITYFGSIDFGRLSDNEVTKINEDFKDHGFNVHLGKREDLQGGDLEDNYYVVFENEEEWTLEDALDVAVYCEETYDKYAAGYVEHSENLNGKREIDLLNPTGDANEDGEVSIADAILIMQAIMNPDEYSLTKQGAINADIDGDGVTTADALAIQEVLTTE